MKKVDMKHLLLTRFAMVMPERPLPISWLFNRYKLLERYTLPSVAAQTCKDFKWLLVADLNFPGIERKRLENYTDVLWTDMSWNNRNAYVKLIKPYTVGVDWLLTTRLDSDDVIADTFIADLQDAFVEREAWYSFPHGYIVKGRKAYARTFVRSPFVSYGELAVHPKTVYWESHMQAGKSSLDPKGQNRRGLTNIIEVSKKPSWVQIDHGGNVSNNVIRFHKSGQANRKWTSVSELKQFTCNWENEES